MLKIEEVPVEFINKLPRRAIATIGETITLSVEISHEADKITWLYNGRPVDESFGSSCFKILSSETIHSLELHNVDYTFAGRIAIQANEAENSTLLEVHGKPQVLIDDELAAQRIELDANDVLRLRLRMKSLPEPEIDVYLNGELITPEFRSTIDIYEHEVVFSRKHMFKADRGRYRVALFNEYGETNHDVEVFVHDVPEAPTGLAVTEGLFR